jgi:aldehyde dehydrogenase (NAD+)
MTAERLLDPTLAAVVDTPPAQIDALFARQAPAAMALRRSSTAERIARLKRLRDALLARREALHAAFQADLRKPALEVELTELLPVVDEARDAIRHLARWMRPQRVGATLSTLGNRAWTQSQPRGRCLVIGPWNYPVNTLLGPLVSALAAGNTVVLKPSELTPHVNGVVDDLVRATFDPAEVAVVQGGVATATRLLTLPFDHVFFTGSPAVGRIVMTAAARHLTSVTLELGGKSPVIVDASADLERAAEITVWGKLINLGQSCVAPDHLYVHESVRERFVALCQAQLARRYGAGAAEQQRSNDLGRLVSVRHAERVAALVDDALDRGAVARTGGTHDTASRWVAPTLLERVPVGARIHEEEIFGPVLPIETYTSLAAVLERINAAPKPLALYLWSRDRRTIDAVLRETSSGGVCINHCMQQYAHTGLPFGGVNHSGIGSAHGVHGFRAFSHERAVLRSGPLMLLRGFLPPYDAGKRRLARLFVDTLRRV